jgi:hypothetical protein
MSSLLPSIPLSHILPLLIGISVTIACVPTYFNPSSGIRAFGLPERIASSPSAHSPFILYTSRIHAIGVMLLVFYAQGNYAAVDTVMGAMGFFGVVDVWVCVREGVPWMRGVLGVACGIYGVMGVCKGSR